jgi:hypothetical protein
MTRPPHESLLLELNEETFYRWRHSTLTAAYLLYLGDVLESFRTAAADLVENGNIGDKAGELRGRLLILRELQNLSLGDIQAFYRQEGTEEKNDGNPNAAS